MREFKPIQSDDETLCRGCGYNTTDDERKQYGIVHKDDEDNIVKQYHYCVFCSDNITIPKRFFKSVDFRIHLAKIGLRIKHLKSFEYVELAKDYSYLVGHHYDDIFNAPYKSDEEGNKILNQYEEEYESIEQQRTDISNAPRHLYLEALEEFGGVSDEPPCTRNLSKKQKRKLLRKLLLCLK